MNKPLDIESRGRLRAKNKWIRPGYWPILGAAASLGATALGSYNSYTLENPRKRARSQSLPPTPPNSQQMGSRSRSVSRGRSMSVSPAIRRRSSSSRRRGAISGGITTEQRDFATRYVRRSMPRHRRRRWRSFTRKVQHVMLQMGATQSFNLKFSARKTAGVETQLWDGMMLGGTQPNNNDELLQAFRRAYGTAITNANVDDYKLYIKSLCLDLQIRNNGDKNVIIELHQLICRKSYNQSERIDTHFQTAMGEMQNQTGFTAQAITDPTTTIFQNSIFLQYWKVLKKSQIVIGAGETTTLQLRIPYNRMMSGKLIESHVQAIPGFTRAFIFSMKGAPELNASDVQYSDFDILWVSQTFVNYQIPPGSTRAQTSAP